MAATPTPTPAARDASHRRPAPAAEEQQRDRVDRAAGNRHPDQLRLAQERDQRDRHRDASTRCSHVQRAYEIDAEERGRKPRHRREERRMHEMQHREPVQRGTDTRHDRARDASATGAMTMRNVLAAAIQMWVSIHQR